MSRYHSYLNSTTSILSQYGGNEPFASFLKKYFTTNKKYGSKDRKIISHLCYCYFRLGNALQSIPVGEKIMTAIFLCSSAPDKLLEELKPGWNDKISLTLHEKRDFLSYQFLEQDIFLWKEEISDAIDKPDFIFSHLSQPNLFLRLRPGKEAVVKSILDKEDISYAEVSSNCLALPNSSKVDKVIELNSEAVIQDHSSQKVGDFLKHLKSQTLNYKLSVWDCCAASGGKSIMAKDILGDIDLTVSDVRESILVNLKKRFNEAGIKNYKSFIADLTHNSRLPTTDYDLIIADVPCSGSGTWGRTPEQLCYFNEKKINEYAVLQRKIIDTCVHHLAPGGYFLYITCSVFKRENEEQAAYIKQKFHLTEIKMEWLKGYDKKADTMFVVLFKKSL